MHSSLAELSDSQPFTQTHQKNPAKVNIQQAMQVEVFRIEGCFACFDFG